MEFINNFETRNNNYTSKIKESKFTEGFRKVIEKGKIDICEIIIGNNEIDYSSIDQKQKTQFIIQKKLEIASNVKQNNKYISDFSVSLIQKGLQMENSLSSILYLNEHYKVHCIIHNQDTNKYYRTTLKNYDPLLCIYKNGTWFLQKENVSDYEFSDINDLNKILKIDIEWMIFKPYLDKLNKYKVKDLESIAEEFNIPLKDESGKKKLKKKIYDEINLKYFTQDI